MLGLFSSGERATQPREKFRPQVVAVVKLSALRFLFKRLLQSPLYSRLSYWIYCYIYLHDYGTNPI